MLLLIGFKMYYFIGKYVFIFIAILISRNLYYLRLEISTNRLELGLTIIYLVYCIIVIWNT